MCVIKPSVSNRGWTCAVFSVFPRTLACVIRARESRRNDGMLSGGDWTLGAFLAAAADVRSDAEIDSVSRRRYPVFGKTLASSECRVKLRWERGPLGVPSLQSARNPPALPLAPHATATLSINVTLKPCNTKFRIKRRNQSRRNFALILTSFCKKYADAAPTTPPPTITTVGRDIDKKGKKKKRRWWIVQTSEEKRSSVFKNFFATESSMFFFFNPSFYHISFLLMSICIVRLMRMFCFVFELDMLRFLRRWFLFGRALFWCKRRRWRRRSSSGGIIRIIIIIIILWILLIMTLCDCSELFTKRLNLPIVFFIITH